MNVCKSNIALCLTILFQGTTGYAHDAVQGPSNTIGLMSNEVLLKRLEQKGFTSDPNLKNVDVGTGLNQQSVQFVINKQGKSTLIEMNRLTGGVKVIK